VPKTSAAATDTNEPLTVDVVISVRNRPHLIAKCLDSVRAQFLPPNTVIVVNDGSNDDTDAVLAAYAARWPTLRVIRTEQRGPASARNTGVSVSQASFVAFLDSDDVWQPDKLERQMKLFVGRPEIGLVHCACVEIDERGNKIPGKTIFVQSRRGDVFPDMINNFYHVTLSTAIARRELFNRIGGFNERMVHVEDADLFLRMAHETKVDYIADALVQLRTHAGNSHAAALENDREFVFLQRLRVWNQWLPNIDHDRALPVFRREAMTIVMQRALSWPPSLEALRRFRHNDIPLAKMLFPDFNSFVACLGHETGEIARMSVSRSAALCNRFKYIVATRLIVRNSILLRICKLFGKFHGIERQQQNAQRQETVLGDM
jgi:glycosyltransferase involved in cell wall biosynthesis